jgi:hypothetical protein
MQHYKLLLISSARIVQIDMIIMLFSNLYAIMVVDLNI